LHRDHEIKRNRIDGKEQRVNKVTVFTNSYLEVFGVHPVFIELFKTLINEEGRVFLYSYYIFSPSTSVEPHKTRENSLERARPYFSCGLGGAVNLPAGYGPESYLFLDSASKQLRMHLRDKKYSKFSRKCIHYSKKIV